MRCAARRQTTSRRIALPILLFFPSEVLQTTNLWEHKSCENGVVSTKEVLSRGHTAATTVVYHKHMSINVSPGRQDRQYHRVA